MANIILNQINKVISDLDDGIIVLKGIPLNLFCDEKSDLDSIADNKLRFFMSSYQNRKFYSYEEFLLIKEMAISQYKKIYIVNNNLYMRYYPVYLNCSDKTKTGLLTHFTEAEDISKDEDSYIGDIENIINLFVGLKAFNGYYLGSYNDSGLVDEPKIEVINVWDNANEELCIIDETQCGDYIEISSEDDYVKLINYLSQDPSELNVCIDNFHEDGTLLFSHLQMIAYYWKEYLDFSIVRKKEQLEPIKYSEETLEILKKYWGYTKFQDISFYDLNKLNEGKKEVKEISQGRIISDLITQVENCIDGAGQPRDIFVTAPTGAGKSVMFQIPAIYLAEKHNLLTIVISPLIGLMKDQVSTLELKDYNCAETINSDISPIIKNQIIERVNNGECHILYISPETLLSRSDVEQLIGNRTIGMIVIDEAHIVTTWGKQFRPDYWYLGDHIRKLRKRQRESEEHNHQSFVIATFTATAIYKGIENMYDETINSLNMINPITYLGYVIRKDIKIDIERKKKEKGARSEYELDKFDDIASLIKRAVLMNKKTLVYFPKIVLIDRCLEMLRAKGLSGPVAIYHAGLIKDEKQEYYEKFRDGEKMVMLATKAFGMGIDINDIQIVAHFAPTGNVCDYVQEIGRAARRKDLVGEADYKYDSRDFKHINQLHGLSTIKEYQLIEVMKKIVALYNDNLRKEGKNSFTRKRNAMLIDAENFSYIFNTNASDKRIDDDGINKVKTALLILQKDFESSRGFSPINIRPIPLFAIGYFEVDPIVQTKLNRINKDLVQEINSDRHICRVNLEILWKKKGSEHSFPQFKYLLYTQSSELTISSQYPMKSAFCVNVVFTEDHSSLFRKTWDALRAFVDNETIDGNYVSVEEISQHMVKTCGISTYKAKSICEVVIAAINLYKRDFKKTTTPIVTINTANNGKSTYRFNISIREFFDWVETKYRYIINNEDDGEFYLVNDSSTNAKEINTVLGILEVMGILTFKMIGGANSQLYIYINQIQAMRNILDKPNYYKNRLLETVNQRHLISVKMLTYIYESGYSNDEIWNLLEDYFLGKIPEEVKKACKKEDPNIKFE